MHVQTDYEVQQPRLIPTKTHEAIHGTSWEQQISSSRSPSNRITQPVLPLTQTDFQTDTSPPSPSMVDIWGVSTHLVEGQTSKAVHEIIFTGYVPAHWRNPIQERTANEGTTSASPEDGFVLGVGFQAGNVGLQPGDRVKKRYPRCEV